MRSATNNPEKFEKTPEAQAARQMIIGMANEYRIEKIKAAWKEQELERGLEENDENLTRDKGVL